MTTEERAKQIVEAIKNEKTSSACMDRSTTSWTAQPS